MVVEKRVISSAHRNSVGCSTPYLVEGMLCLSNPFVCTFAKHCGVYICHRHADGGHPWCMRVCCGCIGGECVSILKKDSCAGF